MRITQTHRAIILSGVEEYIDADVEVLVFGSRLDDTKRGGSVDLLLTSKTEISELSCDELKSILEEYLKLPVNIVTYDPSDEPSPRQAKALAEALPID
ncbi:nucleotidyltransferase domain-containing protein [Halomonas alkaliantarctica]|uniref:Nucleotidyltransferase domain-containing protein n=1 Tax=Halomonas alkaliantarctica TaxID=232346 RepID=A0ABY8LIR1_9GAMM|nr:nucleotidyltransferase domain-containing protein [Halomonas alkaliantarctica]WGI24245.1 nucleotidyltransferase domain-containing protein [Halomonas alkaliantarctica]